MLKSIGMVRKVDQLGRIVLPIELRSLMGLNEGEAIEFFLNEEARMLALRKYGSNQCVFCQSLDQLIYYKEKFICNSCLSKIYTQEAILLEVAAAQEESIQDSRFIQKRHGEAFDRLIEVMESHPDATNGEWATLIGVSQGRVSQLLARMGKRKRIRKPKDI